MKTTSIIMAVLLAACASLFAYANFRTRSVTESLPLATLTSFNIDGKIKDAEALEKKVSGVKGVTACSVNARAHTASIIFHPNQISEPEIASLLSEPDVTVTHKELNATAAGCPVHALGASVQQLISTLDLRSN